MESARASLRVEGDGHAEVQLDLRVGVRGGWLEGLEIAGLDPDFELLGEIRFVAEDGTVHHPRVQQSDGRVWLRFDRASAPRRGKHEVSVRYRTDLGPSVRPEGDQLRLEWTLPGWRNGLDGVEVMVDAPAGATFAQDDEGAATVARSARDVAGRAVLTWRRAHMPRTVPWTIAFTLPRDVALSALSDRLEVAPLGAPSPAVADPPSDAPAPLDAPVGLLPLLAFFTLASSATFARRTRRRGASPCPLIPMPARLRVVLTLGAVSVGAWFPQALLPAMAAIGTLGWQRTPHALRTPRLGAWRGHPGASGIEMQTQEERFFDLSHPLGVITLGVSLGLGMWIASASWLVGWLVVPWLSGTDTQLPRSLDEKRMRLLAYAARTRARCAFAFAVHEDADGHPQDVRLRLVTTHRPVGLVRLDLVCADQVGPGGLYPVLRLLVVTREGSPAEVRAAEALPKVLASRLPGGRVARCAPTDAVTRVLAAMDEAPIAPSTPRRTRRSLEACSPLAPRAAH